MSPESPFGGGAFGDQPFGPAPDTGQDLAPILVDIPNTFYAPTVFAVGAPQTCTPARYNNTNTFYVPTVGRGVVGLAPVLYTDGDTFYVPQLDREILPARYNNTNTFYVPQLDSTKNLVPGLFTTTNTFYSPSLVGFQSISHGSRFNNTNTFYTPIVTPSYGLIPGRYDSPDSIFSPSMLGFGGIAPGRYDNTSTFYVPTFGGAYTLSPGRHDNANTFYTPQINFRLTAALFTNFQALFAHVALSVKGLTPALYTDGDVFYVPAQSNEKPLTPSYYNPSNTFFTHVLAAKYTLAPGLYTDADTFNRPVFVATNAAQGVLPGRYDNSAVNTFYVPVITRILIQLAPARFDSVNTFYDPYPIIATQFTLAPIRHQAGAALTTFNPGHIDPGIELTNANLTATSRSAEASQFLSRVSVTDARAALYEALIDGLVADGIWSKIAWLYILAAPDQATALTNLINSTHTMTNTNSMTFTTDRGFTGDGISMHLAGNRGYSVSSPMAQDSEHNGVWINVEGNGLVDMGSPSTNQHIMHGRTSGSCQVRTNSSVSITVTVPTAVGHLSGSRYGATALKAYKNGELIGTGTTASAALTSVLPSIGRSVSTYTTDRIAAAHIGSDLSDIETRSIYNRLNTILTAIGAN